MAVHKNGQEAAEIVLFNARAGSPQLLKRKREIQIKPIA